MNFKSHTREKKRTLSRTGGGEKGKKFLLPAGEEIGSEDHGGSRFHHGMSARNLEKPRRAKNSSHQRNLRLLFFRTLSRGPLLTGGSRGSSGWERGQPLQDSNDEKFCEK